MCKLLTKYLGTWQNYNSLLFFKQSLKKICKQEKAFSLTQGMIPPLPPPRHQAIHVYSLPKFFQFFSLNTQEIVIINSIAFFINFKLVLFMPLVHILQSSLQLSIVDLLSNPQYLFDESVDRTDCLLQPLEHSIVSQYIFATDTQPSIWKSQKKLFCPSIISCSIF